MARVEPLATTDELAEFLRLPPKTLAEWRSKGTGPAYSKVGVHVRYEWKDVREWLQKQQRQPISA